MRASRQRAAAQMEFIRSAVKDMDFPWIHPPHRAVGCPPACIAPPGAGRGAARLAPPGAEPGAARLASPRRAPSVKLGARSAASVKLTSRSRGVHARRGAGASFG